MKLEMCQVVPRKPGRPKVIPTNLIPCTIQLYKDGFGYRSIANILREEGISVNWSTVRRLIKEELIRERHPKYMFWHYRSGGLWFHRLVETR